MVCCRLPSTVSLNGIAEKLVARPLETVLDRQTCKKSRKPVGVKVMPPRSKDGGPFTGAESRSADPAAGRAGDETGPAACAAAAGSIFSTNFCCISRRLRSSSISSCCFRTWDLRRSISSCTPGALCAWSASPKSGGVTSVSPAAQVSKQTADRTCPPPICFDSMQGCRQWRRIIARPARLQTDRCLATTQSAGRVLVTSPPCRHWIRQSCNTASCGQTNV
jgi:hypothetical protein